MKEKKGKKSLRDVDNLVVKRSTRFKELSKSLSTTQFGTNSISIRTTSDYQNSRLKNYITRTKDICRFFVEYGLYYYTEDKGDYYEVKAYNKNNITLVDTVVAHLGGWWYYVNDRTGIDILKNESGYLFVFFPNANNIDGICSYCPINSRTELYDKACMFNNDRSITPYPEDHQSFILDQGGILTVVISSISEINALNLTFASQSNGVYLSTAINNALVSGNQTIINVIDDLKKSDGYTTLITITEKPNPIEIDGGSTKLYELRNPVQEGRDNFGFFYKYKDFNVLDVISADKFKSGDRGSNIFTEFMIITYTTGYSVSFVFENGVESGIVGTLDQLDQLYKTDDNHHGFRVIRVRKTFGIGSFFGNTNTVGFTISFNQPPYFETQDQDQVFSSKRLSINFNFEIKFE